MDHSPPETDRLFRILSHSYRRHTLAALATAESPMTVRDLTTTVVSREHSGQFPDVPGDAVKEVYLSLIHAHIPLLEDAELIEYDPHRELVQETDLSDVRPLLSEIDDDRLELAR